MTSPTSSALEGIAFLQEALAAMAAVEAAERLGVLARLDDGPVTPAALTRDGVMGERGGGLLLAALAGLGLVESTGDESYRATVPDLVGLVSLISQWQSLDEVLRQGRPAVAGDSPAGAETHYGDVVRYLGVMFAPAAELAADHLAGPDLRILDLGAGAAPWSLAIARRDPKCRVKAVDLPAVLPATRGAVAAAGLEPQFDYLAGDLFAVDWDRPAYDLAILGNLCHLFDESTNRRLLARASEALRPGGKLAILDVLPNEGMEGPLPVVLYALGLLMRTASGRAYPFSTYVGWLREAGYESIERFDLSAAPPITLIVASCST